MNLKLIIITTIIILVIALAVWYLYYNSIQQLQQNYNIQSGSNPDTDTTPSILNDLSRALDDSPTNNEMDSLNLNLQNF